VRGMDAAAKPQGRVYGVPRQPTMARPPSQLATADQLLLLLLLLQKPAAGSAAAAAAAARKPEYVPTPHLNPPPQRPITGLSPLVPP
ncbi:hypothetical protein ABE587_16580, partial [[Pseudomonas] hibiscicola]